MDIRAASLALHYRLQGKLEMVSRCPIQTQEDLSLAYTPGVAAPCLEIQKDPALSFQLTRRRNLVAVITDGSAVLGLGDIGPLAGHAGYGRANAFCSRSSPGWTRFPSVWTPRT